LGDVIVVNYHDDLKEVQGDPAIAALCTPAPFDRPEWWQNLRDNCAIQPLIAVASAGQHRAVLPLMRQGRQICAFANWYNFTVSPLFTDGANKAALLTALAQDLAGEAPRLALAPLPDEHSEASLLESCFAAAGWRVFREQCDVNHVLAVNGRSFAEYLAARPGQLRTTLKRKASKVRTVLSSEFDPRLWDDYAAIYAASWKPSEGSLPFLRRFAEQEGAAGRLRMAFAYADATPVAAQFWTVENGTAYIHKLAHTEAAKPLSPGTTLSAALFEQVIDRDLVTLVDFGTGNDGYKRDWMEAVRPRFRLECFRPAWPGNWPSLAKRALLGLARSNSDG
jgi:CelD/BcsL family acetyltransferase involved in cellulose biosynthesis